VLYRRLIDRLSSVPGVLHVAFVNHRPMNAGVPTGLEAPGYVADANNAPLPLYKTASEAYPEAIGLRVLRGRWFTRAEIDAKHTGVVINTRLANRLWPNEDPIGKSLTVHRSSQARPVSPRRSPAQ
jgi:putative ABC transport system permease protein